MDKGNSIVGLWPALPAPYSTLPFDNNSALPSGGSYATMAAECEGKGGKNMAVDKVKKNISDRRWKEKAYSQKAISFRIDSGVPDALDKMKETTGQSISNYIIMATTRQLIADGYLSPSDEPEE